MGSKRYHGAAARRNAALMRRLESAPTNAFRKPQRRCKMRPDQPTRLPAGDAQ
jgi:hypothetical protein